MNDRYFVISCLQRYKLIFFSVSQYYLSRCPHKYFVVAVAVFVVIVFVVAVVVLLLIYC